MTSLVLTSGIAAQGAVKVTFDSNDFKSIGVYDTWEASPFRTGTLQGNTAVIANPLPDEANESEKVLAVQRSRHGSNTFGVRIDLNEPFELTTSLKYVHVMINTPQQGRVMLIGLGKRTDRPEQSKEVEQFWVMSRNDITAGEWSDAVFAIKGAGGIEIHSLVVVPYAESPHTLTSDFVAYVDDIELNSSSMPRVGADDYVLNFSADAVNSRYSERHISDVKLDNATIETPGSTYYQSLLDKTFNVKAGQTVLPSINYVGTWMHGYVYIDRDNDGQFSYELNGRVPADGSDLVAYSYYEGYNHKGSSASNSSWTMSNFTIPADLPVGMYRMRFKIDWNCVDPGGNTDPSNLITSNAGGIIDVMLNVHADKISVSQANRNGEVVAADGSKLDNYQTDFGQPFKIKMVPENGFDYAGIVVRHGYNLDGKETIHGNPQYREITYTHDLFDDDDTFTIPAEVMDGDVRIEGLFIEQGTLPESVKITYNIESEGKVIATQTFNVLEGDEYPTPSPIETEVSPEFYTFAGIPEGTVGNSDEEITLTVENNLPFEVSSDLNNVYWYNLSITADRNYLNHSSTMSYIGTGATTASVPSATNYNAQWAFVGNIFSGFKIINRGAGEGYILSSSTNTASNTGGNTYPIMTAEPVPASNNTYWIPTFSEYIAGQNGFYLHQLGLPSNRMNSRDSRLAYWTGGADAGSTFIATLVDSYSGIGNVGIDFNAPVDYYNLQGAKVDSENLAPGIYLVRQGQAVAKVRIR